LATPSEIKTEVDQAIQATRVAARLVEKIQKYSRLPNPVGAPARKFVQLAKASIDQIATQSDELANEIRETQVYSNPGAPPSPQDYDAAVAYLSDAAPALVASSRLYENLIQTRTRITFLRRGIHSLQKSLEKTADDTGVYNLSAAFGIALLELVQSYQTIKSKLNDNIAQLTDAATKRRNYTLNLVTLYSGYGDGVIRNGQADIQTALREFGQVQTERTRLLAAGQSLARDWQIKEDEWNGLQSRLISIDAQLAELRTLKSSLNAEITRLTKRREQRRSNYEAADRSVKNHPFRCRNNHTRYSECRQRDDKRKYDNERKRRRQRRSDARKAYERAKRELSDAKLRLTEAESRLIKQREARKQTLTLQAQVGQERAALNQQSIDALRAWAALATEERDTEAKLLRLREKVGILDAIVQQIRSAGDYINSRPSP
jgi:chromosome segregation ATPase